MLKLIKDGNVLEVMYPQTHFLAAWFLSLILVKLGILSHKAALVCAVLAVLLDLDHWIAYVIHERKLSIKKAWNVAAVTHDFEERTFIHHKTGFIVMTIFLILMLLFNRLVFWVAGIAYYSHMFLDYVHVWGRGKIIKFKEMGFGFQISGFEIILDFILLMGIIFLVLV